MPEWTKVLIGIPAGLAAVAIFIAVPYSESQEDVSYFAKEEQTVRGYDATRPGVRLPAPEDAKRDGGEEHPAYSKQTCKIPGTQEQADLCAQWASVAAVGRGNNIAIANLRATHLAIIMSSLSFLVGALGLIIAALATRAAAKAVVAVENLDRGLIDVRIAEQEGSRLLLTLRNVGATPVWLKSVVDDQRGALVDAVEGIVCLCGGDGHTILVEPHEGANPGRVNLTIAFRDVLDGDRSVRADLLMRKERWRLDSLSEQRA